MIRRSSAAFEADPLTHPWATPRLATEAEVVRAQIRQGAATWRVPTLMLHGGADPICVPEGARLFAVTDSAGHGGLPQLIPAFIMRFTTSRKRSRSLVTSRPGCRLDCAPGSCGRFERIGSLGDRRRRAIETMIKWVRRSI